MESLNELGIEVEFGPCEIRSQARDFGVIAQLRELLRATRRQYMLYVAVYIVWGSTMDTIGKLLVIAEFRHWWQILTCYVGYLVPVSLMLRNKSMLEQYVYGVVALAPLELLGYALGTSIAHDGNVLDAVLGPRNLTLAMCIFFGIIPPVGNGLVRWIEGRFFETVVNPELPLARPGSSLAAPD